MTKIYVLGGYGVEDNRFWTNEEEAKKACADYNYCEDCSGGHQYACVKEKVLAENK